MAKTATLTASISSDERVSHIGRYFLDLRNTTNGQNRQMTTRIKDREGAIAFLAECKEQAEKHGIELTTVEETLGELAGIY